jgi:hypothetical protein
MPSLVAIICTPHAVKIAALARHCAAIKFILQQPTPLNPNVVAHRDGKRIKQIARFPMQVFECCCPIDEKDDKSNPASRFTRRENRDRLKSRFISPSSCRKRRDFFKITAEMQHRSNGNGNDFGVETSMRNLRDVRLP